MRMFFAGLDNSKVFVFAGLDNSTAFVFAGLDNSTAFGWVFPKLFLPLSLSISQDVCPVCVSLIRSHFRSHSIFYLIIFRALSLSDSLSRTYGQHLVMFYAKVLQNCSVGPASRLGR